MTTQDKRPADTVHPAADAPPGASTEAQLREAQRTAAIGTLAGGIARELNNALTSILGNVELVRRDVSDHALVLESLEEISKAGLRARALVQQLLYFSRRQPTARKRTLLGPVIEESMHLLRATLPARLALEVYCDADVPPAHVDASQIEQIVINLSAKVIQGMHRESGRLDVRLDAINLDAVFVDAHPALSAMHARYPGRTVRLAVSDDGPGMDATTLENLFEPCVTARPMGENAGLSLSEMRDIVQAHEGAVEIDSRPGIGTTFTLYLPATETHAGVAKPEESTVPGVPGMGRGQHILYIDDDDSLVFLVERHLERRGFRVSGYVDPREALDALRTDPHAFNLAVIDYHMPDMSGLNVAREVRAIRPDLTVAMASGVIDETLRAQAKDAGVRELIFKASEVEDLCEAFVRLAQSVQKTPKSP